MGSGVAAYKIVCQIYLFSKRDWCRHLVTFEILKILKFGEEKFEGAARAETNDP